MSLFSPTPRLLAQLSPTVLADAGAAKDVDPVLVLALGTIAFFCLAFTLSLWALRRTGVPVYSAAPWIVRMAIAMLQLKDGERFCDLGCGLGRVLRSARRAARVEATGYELNPFAILYLWALNITDFGIRVKWRDFRRADLSRFDAVYLYLIPKALPGLADQLERQLKPGARVVSVDFPIPGWQAREEREQGQKIWLYVMGEHRAAQAAAPTPASGEVEASSGGGRTADPSALPS